MMMSNEERCFDDVLEKNYSPEISDEEKNCIQAIISQMKRLLNWDIEENEHLFDKESGLEIVSDLITQFNYWKSVNDRLINNMNDNNVAMPCLVNHAIAKLCFYYWIRDSQIVSEVLIKVYDCDGQFSSMFASILQYNERTLIWPTTNRETKQKLYITILYFLTHAHRTKLEFSGVRFVDLKFISFEWAPVFLAAIYADHQLLYLLLRYGAIVDQRLAGGQLYYSYFNMWMRYLVWTLWASLGMETAHSSWDTTIISSTVNDKLLCMRFLLRGIRQIPMGSLEFPLMKYVPNGHWITSNSHDFIRSVSEQGIVPTLVNRYLEPPGLRHLCRLVIRNALNRNFNLPFGVFSLPLPKVLQRYVNLSED